jgi:predicted amidophosphoribosyltransferase
MTERPTFFCGGIVLEDDGEFIPRRICVSCGAPASIHANSNLCEACCGNHRSSHIYDGPRCRYCGAEKPEPGK